MQGIETGFDLSQTLASGELSECHAQKLVKAGEVPRVPISIILPDALVEIVSGQVIQYLGKDRSAKMHWSILSVSSVEAMGQSIAES
jgi:hypothetical protein